MYGEIAAEDRSILVTAFNGKVFGLDRRSGNVAWSVAIESHGGGAADLVVAGGVVVACTRRRLAILDYQSGRTIAQVPLVGAYPDRPTMIVDGGQILVGRNGEVACYTLGGEFVWLQKFEGKGLGRIAVGLPGNVRQADDAG